MQDIEETIETEEEDDMRCYVLNVLAPCDHIELRQNGASLQPNRKCFKNPIKSKTPMKEEGKCS